MLDKVKRFGRGFEYGVWIGVKYQIDTWKLVGGCTKTVGNIILKNVCEEVTTDEKVIDRIDNLIKSY